MVAVVQRDRGILAKRAQQLELQEDQRRRNRFVMLFNHDRTLENDDCDHRTSSEVYIEDAFATSSPRTVVENLTYVQKAILSRLSWTPQAWQFEVTEGL